MMAQLLEEQWELDGYVFGGNGSHRKPVFILHSGLDYGSSAVRHQDSSAPGQDGFMMGRDYYDGPEFQFTLGVEGTDVWDAYAALAKAWRPPSRTMPGSLSTLRFMRNGKSYRVYGRPRQFGIKPAVNKNDQFQVVDCSFQLAEPVQYREANQAGNEVTLILAAYTSDGGLVLPAEVPFELRAGSQTRANGATINSPMATPFEVYVKGPVAGTLSNISLGGSGWRITTSATLAYDQTLYVNTRTQVIQRNGVNIPGTLSQDSRLTARLQPGNQLLSFTGTDPSNTASARFVWFDSIPI